jgi:hypothetical protein
VIGSGGEERDCLITAGTGWMYGGLMDAAVRVNCGRQKGVDGGNVRGGSGAKLDRTICSTSLRRRGPG